ncbi:intraflagellar transport protein 74 homolog isoform X2 [Penaeus japonicus]|uniref:intraflagellar transport protein 74 homolog isoform X2 n=1 Tax=Penaeus japonicus TaxID=27405 RepID=UPI001C712572|nr:intraflagellar transport protein 74 homolog isoform X2 [Penaeus japonicus]
MERPVSTLSRTEPEGQAERNLKEETVSAFQLKEQSQTPDSVSIMERPVSTFSRTVSMEPVEEEDENQGGESIRQEESEAVSHDQGKTTAGGNPKSQVQVIITEESTVQGQGHSRVASAVPRAGEIEGRTGTQEETEAQGRVETGSALEYQGKSTAITTMDEIPVNRDGPTFENRPATSGEGPFGRGMSMGDRPGSRSMSMERPDTRQQSSFGDRTMSRQGDGNSRPTTSGRPITARPISAALRNAPGTASRLLSTASVQRPGARTGVATGIGFNTPISVVDRPITQQGLSGMKTSSRGPQRQVQDKSYFMGLLRTKITDLGAEITHLSTDIDKMKQEQSTFLTYDKRVKEMAQELTELQGTLGDYNLLVDLLNTDTEQIEIEEEIKSLKDTNKEEGDKLDSLFSHKQDLESMMRQLEVDIEEERHMGESLLEAMQPNLRQKYFELRQTNTTLLQHLDQMQLELDALDNRKAALEDELALSKVKQEAVGLYEKLQDLEEKKAEIINENQKRGTPKEERERLLLQVKEDNTEIATMERQIGEVQDHIHRVQEELQQLDQDLEENQSERSQKYRELRKREETMEQFLATFDKNKQDEVQRLETLEKNNVVLLEKLSRNLAHFNHLPSTRDFDVMQSDLAFKEGELEKSKYTEQGLKQEHLNLQSNLQKIEALELKIQKEMVELKEKLVKMEKEMVEFSDLDGLRTRAEEKRRNLAEEKEQLDERKGAVTQNLQEIESTVKSLKKQLNENETYTQLTNLEKKWAHLEQSNFTLQEFVAQRRAESNFLPLQNQAMKLVQDYNKLLQDVVQNGTIM